MKEETQKRSYVTPELTVVDFKVERGFEVSNVTFHQILMWDNQPNQDQMEQYTDKNGWHSGGQFWD